MTATLLNTVLSGYAVQATGGRVLSVLFVVLLFVLIPSKLAGQWNGDEVKNLVQDVNNPADLITVPVTGEGFYLVWKDEVAKKEVLKFAYYNNNGDVQMRADGKYATMIFGKKENISAHLTIADHLIIIWRETDPVAGDNIYAQRVTQNGLLVYGDEGKKILGPLKNVDGITAEVNDSGDIFVAYSLRQNGYELFVKKVGLYELPVDEKVKQVFESPKAKHLLSLSEMQGGGVFLAWIEEDKIFTQFVDVNGDLPWGDVPKQITSNADNTVSFRTLPVSDTVIYFCYQTLTRKGTAKTKSLAQTAITKSGNFFWKERPVQMLASKGNPSNPQLALAADSTILISYVLDNSSPQGSLVQKVDRKTGKLLWGLNGKQVEKRKAGIHPLTRITSDGKGGAIVSWLLQIRGEKAGKPGDTVQRKTDDKLYICAQRLNRKGDLLWDSTGKVVSGSDIKDKSYLNLFSDGVNGGIFIYKESSKSGSAVYGKRLFSNGSTQSRFTEFSHILNTDTLTLFWRPIENISVQRFLIEVHPPQDEESEEDTVWMPKATVLPDPLKPITRYSFTTLLPSTGTYAYRVGIITTQGDTIYSDARTIVYTFDEVTGEEDLYNYPNPFSDKTTIYFTLASPTKVKFEFYNTSMEKIHEERVDRTFAGKNGLEFSAEGLKSGIYFYKMIIGKYAIVRKFLVAK